MLNPCAPLLSDEIIRRAKNLNVPLLLDGVFLNLIFQAPNLARYSVLKQFVCRGI